MRKLFKERKSYLRKLTKRDQTNSTHRLKEHKYRHPQGMLKARVKERVDYYINPHYKTQLNATA